MNMQWTGCQCYIRRWIIGWGAVCGRKLNQTTVLVSSHLQKAVSIQKETNIYLFFVSLLIQTFIILDNKVVKQNIQITFKILFPASWAESEQSLTENTIINCVGQTETTHKYQFVCSCTSSLITVASMNKLDVCIKTSICVVLVHTTRQNMRGMEKTT